MTDRAKTPDELRAYFGAVASALSALERRLVARGNFTGEEALAEIRRYRAAVRDNLAALEDAAGAAAEGLTPPSS